MKYKDLPEEIQKVIALRVVEQGNVYNPNTAVRKDADSGGFVWEKSVEGYDFWRAILFDNNFDIFYEKYPPSVTVVEELSVYGDFPEEIQEIIKLRVEEVGNMYRKNTDIRNTDTEPGGFSWGHTVEGYNFWQDVLSYKNFKLFYEKYPKNITNITNNLNNNKYDISRVTVKISHGFGIGSALCLGNRKACTV